MNHCRDCMHWSRHDDGHPIYNADAIRRHPDWEARGLCVHPASKMHPEWEGAEAISTDPDFGCVQFEPRPLRKISGQ